MNGPARPLSSPQVPVPGPNHLTRIVSAHGAGGEALNIETPAGLSVEILIDSGLDIGRVAIRGLPISHATARGAAWPPDHVSGAWLERWTGGLVTTCGLRNVGAPSDGHGQHGDYVERRACGVVAEHREIDGESVVVVRGVVRDAVALSHVLEVERTVTVWTGRPRILLEDRLTNHGHRTEQTPLLYHVNFGYPFLTPDTVVKGIDAIAPRDEDSAWCADWPSMGSPMADETELVAECTLSGPPRVEVESPASGVRVQVAWSPDTLPRLHVWRHRRATGYVLAIEPANCSVQGRAHDREAGRAPTVTPGMTRTTTLDISISDTTAP